MLHVNVFEIVHDPPIIGVHEAPETISSAPSYTSWATSLYCTSLGPSTHFVVVNTSGMILLSIVGNASARPRSLTATESKMEHKESFILQSLIPSCLSSMKITELVGKSRCLGVVGYGSFDETFVGRF